MLAVNYSTARNNLKHYCDKVSGEDETVIVTRKDAKNVVMISLERYDSLTKAAKTAPPIMADQPVRKLKRVKKIARRT